MISRAIYIIVILTFGIGLSTAQNKDFLEYIEQNKTLAVTEMERTGIPASIKMAQALLESNAGRSELAKNANNHFGIKCGNDWEGKTYKKKDDERNVLGMRVKSCFRHFRSIQESFIAHSELLRAPNRQSRYSFLFDLDPKDYKGWAKGLKSAGYATSNSYHRKLINLIEQYDLHQLDFMTTSGMVASNSKKRKDQPENREWPKPVEVDFSGNPTTQRADVVQSVKIDYHNDVKYIVSPKQETVATIAELAGITTEEVLRYNESFKATKQIVAAGTRVYMQPKRNNFRGRETWYKVQSGESMLYISNKYAIDLNRLYLRNKLEKDQEPAPGAKIKLKGSTVDRPPALRHNRRFNEDERPEKIIIEDEDIETLNIEIEWNGGNPKKRKADTTAAGISTDNRIALSSAPGNPGPQTRQPAEPFGNSQEPVTENAPMQYTVQQGDTLWRISQQYGITVNRIKALNQLDSNHIRSGMVLKVK